MLEIFARNLFAKKNVRMEEDVLGLTDVPASTVILEDIAKLITEQGLVTGLSNIQLQSWLSDCKSK